MRGTHGRLLHESGMVTVTYARFGPSSLTGRSAERGRPWNSRLTNDEDVIGALEGGVDALLLVEDLDGVVEGGGLPDRGHRGEGSGRGDAGGDDGELHG